MPRRFYILANEQIYHVFNRSISKTDIFHSQQNLTRALQITEYYRFHQRYRYSKFRSLKDASMLDYERHYRNQLPLVEIYSYSYMPNHYHFLLKQKQDKGVQLFIGNLQNSFAKYFNIKNSRDGGLFQNSFKAKRVETDEEFIHISRYIHLNPVTSYLIEFNKLTTYPWTSFPIYAGNSPSNFINTLFITHHFKTKEKYIQFCADQVNYQRNLNKIKHLLVD